jgi:CHAD domain-containing protein
VAFNTQPFRVLFSENDVTTGKPAKYPSLQSSLSVSEAIAIMLGHTLHYLTEWEQEARTPDNIEGVHQTRVAFRRMRSILGSFRTVIPKNVSVPWRNSMRDLAGELGRARDADVFIDEALGEVRGKLDLPGQEALEDLAVQYRACTYEAVCKMLDSKEYARFKTDFGTWIETRGWDRVSLKKKPRKRLDSSLVSFARDVLDQQEHQVLEAGTYVDKHAADQMHRLRIECKKLRYAGEYFSPLFPGMHLYIQEMKGLQDLLGVMHDVAVTRGLLNEMLAGVNNAAVLQSAGGIIGWRTRHHYELLDEFEESWEHLVEAKHPWWAMTDSTSDTASTPGEERQSVKADDTVRPKGAKIIPLPPSVTTIAGPASAVI